MQAHCRKTPPRRNIKNDITWLEATRSLIVRNRSEEGKEKLGLFSCYKS